ncbi:angiopoietin-1 receptor-like isoform X1 [Pocillopora damicornis]|uniref:angiopoietin-1 receptor-like isoform X1 n=1 Tax=Pocillopora damicornis TaxID=46731 RepID=UPI000F557A0A|nr:angiopoietin-1 receptor-like isoform X1 [Pocillopora damicornis]
MSLNCTISGDGSYTWERQDGIEVENAKRQVKGGGRLLEIIDAAIADSGAYTCKVGEISHTITLQVLVQVKVEMALKVENYNYTKELENKSSPQYEAIAKNFTEEMDIVYRNTLGYMRNEVLKLTKGSVVVDFNIIIQIVTTDPKNETTTVDKKASVVQTTIKEAKDGFVGRLKASKVIPKTEPPEPNGVEIFDIKSDELSVRWKPSEDAETFDVRTYSVQYRAYGEKTYGEHNQTATTETTDHSYRIKSLEPETVYMIRVGAINPYGPNFNEETGHETEPAPFAWWIIVLAVLGVLLILGILIGIIIYRRRRARDRREQTEARFRALENQTGSHKGEVAAYHGENVKGLTYSFKNTAYKPGEMNWEEFPHENIKLLDELGSGAFGIVFKGELQQENGNIIPCAVKTLKPSATKVERKDLYNELEIMANVGHHPNLVNLIGACTQDDLLLVIIELAENGCLLDFLKQSRQQDGNNTTSGLTEHMKTSIAVDVAQGMAHLADCRCIHRDLAARNVLLGKDYVAKVSDYGMARSMYEQLMYKKETQGKLPVKWMAIESLETYTFTMKSDVWAYGVLLWEIESGGLKPYAGDSTSELIEKLKNGYRMEKPNGCSDEMYQAMRDCWNPNPNARPNFDELIVRLESKIMA